MLFSGLSEYPQEMADRFEQLIFLCIDKAEFSALKNLKVGDKNFYEELLDLNSYEITSGAKDLISRILQKIKLGKLGLLHC